MSGSCFLYLKYKIYAHAIARTYAYPRETRFLQSALVRELIPIWLIGSFFFTFICIIQKFFVILHPKNE